MLGSGFFTHANCTYNWSLLISSGVKVIINSLATLVPAKTQDEKSEQDTYEYYVKIGPKPKEINE